MFRVPPAAACFETGSLALAGCLKTSFTGVGNNPSLQIHSALRVLLWKWDQTEAVPRPVGIMTRMAQGPANRDTLRHSLGSGPPLVSVTVDSEARGQAGRFRVRGPARPGSRA
jgi:hypothetical protein